MSNKGIVFQLMERIEALEARLNSIQNVNSKKYYSLEGFSELTGYSKHICSNLNPKTPKRITALLSFFVFLVFFVTLCDTLPTQ